MSDEKYFLKMFKIDPAEGGIVKASTKLYPYYGSNMDYIDYLNVEKDTESKGSGTEREVIDSDDKEHDLYKRNPILYQGRDLHHGASGLQYVKDNPAFFSDNTDEGDPAHGARYNTKVFWEDPLYATADSDKSRLISDLISLLKTSEFSGLKNADPVLMLVGAPSSSIIGFDDIAKNDWDAWRDSPNELQVKSYTPRMQLPLNDYKGRLDELLDKYFNYYKNLHISDECMKNVTRSFLKDVDGLYRQRNITNSLSRGLGV